LALSKFNVDNYNDTIRFLNEVIELFSELKLAPNHLGKSVWKPMQTGVILTTKSILDLQDYFLNDQKMHYFLTSRVSQDCLENVFSQMRLKQAVPTALQFQQNLKMLSVSQYLQEVPRSSSYEHDVVEPMSGMLTIINSRLISAQNDISQNENILLPHNWNYRGLSLSLSEKNAFYNCIGYILKSLTNTGLRCKKCINSLGSKTETMNEFSRYTILKQY
jgi:hypothetical protein